MSAGAAVAADSSTAPLGLDSSRPGAPHFGIKVQGDHLVSTYDGHTVQLLGVSVSGLEQGNSSFANDTENYGDSSDPGFAAMAEWNINVVRIPLNEDSWLGVNDCIKGGGTAAELHANVQRAVQKANAVGLYVILDLHWTAPNSFGCPQGQGAMPDADNSVAFWQSVASSFKDNPAVIFELFNEPFGTNVYANWMERLDGPAPPGQSAPDRRILLEGGTYDAGYMYECNTGCKLEQDKDYIAPHTAPFRTAGLQTIVDAIRATGATNVMIASPIGYAGQIQTWTGAKPKDSIGQLAAGWHQSGGPRVTVSTAQGLLGDGYPIIITEAYKTGDDVFYWAVNNSVGFLYWAWVDWGGGGLLENAKTHTANANGLLLKASFCRRPPVNRLAKCE
ncbi:MAG: cellulase family glycosylhydrolase [Steroidobacteraceae bacterium]